MSLIALEGMEFYAYHGFYEEEQKIGSYYLVDIYIETNFKSAASTDELSGTINYETIYRITRMEMQRSSKLLEHIGQRIINRLELLFSKMETIKIRITKKNPPVGAQVSKAYIEIEESYWVKCGKCGRSYLSHQPGDSWEKYGTIYPETKRSLQRLHGRNICKSCLTPYFIQPRETEEA